MALSGMFGAKPKNLVGVDIGSSAVKVAMLRTNGDAGNYELEALGSSPLPSDAIVEGSIISRLPVAEAVERVFSEQAIRSNQVATSISGHSVIVKKLSLPSLSKDELEESIQWEAEQYIPFELSEVNLDFEITREIPGQGKVEVLLVAAKKEKIAEYTGVLALAGKVPVVVDLDAFALLNAYEVNYEPEPSKVVAILNIGSSVMTVNIIGGSDFLFTRDIALGSLDYTESLQAQMGISFEKADQYKKGDNVPDDLRAQVEAIVGTVSDNLILEVEKTFDYYKTTPESKEIQHLYICGGGSLIPQLREDLEKTLRLPVEFFDPFKRVRLPNRAIQPEEMARLAPSYAIAVGLALRTAKDR